MLKHPHIKINSESIKIPSLTLKALSVGKPAVGVCWVYDWHALGVFSVTHPYTKSLVPAASSPHLTTRYLLHPLSVVFWDFIKFNKCGVLKSVFCLLNYLELEAP